ncbi:hypothetical protein EV193_10222 [Herbihabitans rhizosphaerae]|uniref:Peptidase inhibitor family I36 n=1 Tax=Herbihabitans rhizosphaerae TaxID=1872711 RepID=A0A4Q7L1V7_9PSEU|nr:hypothetical protein EV193_10222 [Herbihabitans rhizosphaerae]
MTPRNTVKTLFAVFCVMFAMTVAPTAASAMKPSTGSGAYCVVVVGKAPADQTSPILSRTCSDDMSVATRQAGIAGETLLMEWFWNANNNPPKLTRIHGNYGGCDAVGYRINIYDDWANNVSGFNSLNGCNVVTGYDLALAQGDNQTWSAYKACNCLLQGWVGSKMNDRIESFRIRHG